MTFKCHCNTSEFELLRVGNIEAGKIVAPAARDPQRSIPREDPSYRDSSGVAPRDEELQTKPAPTFPEVHLARSLTLSAAEARQHLSMASRIRPHVTIRDLRLVPPLQPQTVEWEQEARLMTFYVESVLLIDTARHIVPGARGELVWVRCGEAAESVTPAVRPALMVHAAATAMSIDRVEVVPHLAAGDPLLRHIGLVLKVEMEAKGMARRVYAEVLANALAVHLLRRCAACPTMRSEVTAGLPPAVLQRIIAHIQANLTDELTLTALAAVAQLSPDYFWRLFRQATGQTPHQYVLLCRIARAKQLLTETTLSLSDICYQVGCADQSYFTALFRRYVGTTPKAYRATPPL